MKHNLIAMAVTALVASNSYAQVLGTAPTYAEGKVSYTYDTDKFKTWSIAGGAVFAGTDGNGFGARITTTEYDGVAKSVGGGVGSLVGHSESVQATTVHLGDVYTWQGAIGVKQTTANASAGAVSQTNSSADLVFDGEIRRALTDTVSAGISLSRDVVESSGGILTNTTVTTLIGDADITITDNLNMSLVLGDSHFSDHNNRQFVRTKLTYTLVPEYGVSAYVRTRNQWDSNPRAIQQYICDGNGCTQPTSYFSPAERYDQAFGLLFVSSSVIFFTSRALLPVSHPSLALS